MVDSNEIKKPNSRIANNYVTYIDKVWKNPTSWLECKRADDNAEGLWRVHDSLYDLEPFIKHHPGGQDWIVLTQGTDITEAFETHHLNMKKVNAVLAKHKVREASKPRNIKLTFKEDGFYQTLKRRVVKKLDEIEKPNNKSNLMIDMLLFGTFAASILSTRIYWFILPAGLFMSWLVIAAHNYFHRKDNFRMNYFNMTFMNYRDWRVSHALSHHLFTNSLVDMEVSVLEPLFCWLPDPLRKGLVNRYVSWIYEPFVYFLFFVVDFLKRFFGSIILQKNLFTLVDMIPFTLPVTMYTLGYSNDLYEIIKTWLTIVCISSLIFATTGINAGHHHPDVFHDGDYIRENLDWGAFQLDTMIDREDLKGNHFLVLTNFGDHILHHLFPTLDHGYLKHLYDILNETVNEFKLELRTFAWKELIIGQHLQLARVEPNDRLKNK